MAPTVCVLIPTLDAARTLACALESVAAQRYEGAVRVVCIDGGSTDGTRELAAGAGAEVLDNPHRDEEWGRAIGVAATDEDLILLLDADNELPGECWLARLVDALALGDDIASADPLHHEWRREDGALTRLCGLIGGIDPLAVELGYADRWAVHLGRWTGLPVLEQIETPDAVLVRLDPGQIPPMGSNGFLIRRAALLQVQHEPFVHSDVVGDLAARGWRFARVRQGIVHHHSRDLRSYAHKARRRARRRLRGVPVQRHRFEPGSAALAVRVLDAVTVVGPAWRALRGYRRRPDPAWALYPVTTLITVGAYAYETLASVVGRRWARAAVLLAATVAASNAMNVVFQLAMARMLGPAEYSLLGTLFAVLMVLSVPTVALQAVVAREVAQDLEAGDEAITGRRLRDTYASLGRATLWAVAVMAVASVPLISLLHIQRPVPIATTAIALMAALPLPVSWGALQGAARFGALSLSQISFSTAKLATGIVLALLGFGATAVMLGLALAGTVAVGFSVVSLRALLRRGAALAPRRRPLFTGYSIGAAAVLTAITALTMSDLVVARLSFSPEVSGAYNAASVAARLMLVLPIAVTTVLFPRVATLVDARSERRHLRAGLAAVGGAAALVVVLFLAAAGPLIDAGFGSRYSAAAPWLGPLGVAMAGYAVLNVYAYHLLALGHARFALLLLAALAVQLALYAGFHASPGQLIAVQVVVALALVAASEVFARHSGRRFAREAAA